MVSPSRCPPWQPERPGPTRREPRRAQRSYTTRRDMIRFIESSHEIPFEQSGLGAALLGMIAHVSSVLMVPAIILVIAAIGGNIVQWVSYLPPKNLTRRLRISV